MEIRFILGAPDPEMKAIEELLEKHNLAFSYASFRGKRVQSNNAYKATSCLPKALKEETIIFVECAVKGIKPRFIIDHHYPGDPGFECGPKDFWKGSSVGQLCNLLELPPTKELKLVAAADHCLSAAYKGLCPGIEPQDIAFFRLNSRAHAQGKKLSALMESISKAEEILNACDSIKIGDELVKIVPLDCEDNSEITEAAARNGIALSYESRDRAGELKKGIIGAEASTVKLWMQEHKKTAISIYGCPQRGYAGAYYGK